MVFKRRGHVFEAINFLGFNNLQLLKLQLPLGRSYFHLNCISAVHIIFILCSFLSRVKWTQQTLRQCIGLHSSVGRALKRQRRGHGFESRWSHSHQNLILKGIYQYPEFTFIVSTPKHFSLTIISWEKAIRIKERLLDVQSDHQESFSARMKSSMIGSFYQPLFGKKNQPTGIFTSGGAGRVWFLLLVSAKWLRIHDHYQGFIQWDAKFQRAY